MTSEIGLPRDVQAAKRYLAEQRSLLFQRHRDALTGRGPALSGRRLGHDLSDLFDTVVLKLYEAALIRLGEDGPNGLRKAVALVAHGGFGRRDVAPYSDVDLMILHDPAAEDRVRKLAECLMRDIFDVGLQLGHSVRTPAQACRLGRREAEVFTSLVESRYLAGSVKLYSRFARRFLRPNQRQSRGLFASIEKSRRDERHQYGDTVYLLEPNVKRSPGGLRDLQLLRWIAFACYGTAEPHELRQRGLLAEHDEQRLNRAGEFLLRLRAEMHFYHDGPADVLDRSEQMRLAELYGYEHLEGQLPVERFMQTYFRHTHAVSTITRLFVNTARPEPRMASVLGPIFSHQFEGDFRVGHTQIAAMSKGLAKVTSSLEEVLRLTEVANLYNVRIEHATAEAIRLAVPTMNDELTPLAADRFMRMLAQPARVGELLRQLHEIGVLKQVIPEMGRARGMLQFNEYHKYTVDEHSLKAVEHAASFQDDPGILSEVYQQIKNKKILHLALLLHDLGKGHVQDHSDVGLEIAQSTAERLGLGSDETEILKFLVHKHLLMSHLAFRRDTSDDKLVVEFSVEVGSLDVLRMLFILTAADYCAVGPKVWNPWKSEVLAELYHRTVDHLAGEQAGSGTRNFVARRRASILRQFSDQKDLAWFKQQIDSLPTAYLRSAPVEQIADELRELSRLPAGEATAQGRYLADRDAVEYTVGTHESICHGIFYRLTGALSSQGLEILGAQICTLPDGLVLDRFFVRDPDHHRAPTPERLEGVCRALIHSLHAEEGILPTYRRVWRSGASSRASDLPESPPRVRIDNSTSEVATIIDIFASDRPGLLHAISRCIFDQGLSVQLAKIGTYLDQVVDVFYVTDRENRKIEDPAQCQQICDRLLETIQKPS
jgi:[protein-PII] uridylyltransferase